MQAEIISGRRVQLASGTITYGEEQLVEALVTHYFPCSNPEIDGKRAETEEIVGQMFDAMEEKTAGQMQEQLDDELATNADLSGQIECISQYLDDATYIRPTLGEKLSDRVVRTIQFLQKQVMVKDAVNVALKMELDDRDAVLTKLEQRLPAVEKTPAAPEPAFC